MLFCLDIGLTLELENWNHGDMRLTVIGCSGSVVSPHSPASCYLLQSAGQRPIIIDIGNGSMGTLQELVDPSGCDLVNSHLHPDHTADIPSLIVWRRYSHRSTTRPATVFGPSTFLKKVGEWFADDYGSCHDLTDTFDFHPWDVAAPQHLNGCTFQAFPADHPGEAYCMRVTEDTTGATFCFSGDTGPCEGVYKASKDVDVFLCEATWTSNPNLPEHMHLTGALAGALASENHVGRLLLTHISPWTDSEAVLAEARETSTVPTELVSPRAVYEW